MSSRKGIVAIALAFAFMLLTAPTPVHGASISEVSHSPAIPKAGEGVDIALRFSDVSNVTSVSIVYCSIASDGTIECEFPQDLARDSQDNTKFKYTITKTYDPSMKVGFKFIIEYDDGRPNEIFPKSQSESSLHKVDGPYAGNTYYFTYTLESASSTDLTLFFIVLGVLVVAFIPLIVAALLLMKKRKAKGRNNEDEE